MKNHRTLPFALLTLAVFATLAGCITVPEHNAALQDAQHEYALAQGDARVARFAPGELRQAGDALNRANEASERRDDTAEVSHLAYLARQRISIAQTVSTQKQAEAEVAGANQARDGIRLDARTKEADAARQSARNSQQAATAAQAESAAAQRDSAAARRDTEAAQLEADDADRQSLDAQRQAGAADLRTAQSQKQTRDAESRNLDLEAQLKDLNAKQSDRGLVITIGDVLFDTNKSQLKSGGRRSIEKLAAFLLQYPKRVARVEGFTDNVGTDATNQELSDRRATAVRGALTSMGVPSERITMRGYGSAYPVASNDSAGSRQLNRRVEVVLSDDGGKLVPR